MRAVDLCCGAGGITRGMLDGGFSVLGVDVIARRRDYPTAAAYLRADVRTLDARALQEGGPVRWLHMSPPCARFSQIRADRVTDPPTEADLDILKACLSIRDELSPDIWTVENVAGAIPLFAPLLGKPRLRHGPYVFWGNFPAFLVERAGLRKGMSNGLRGEPDRHRSPWLRAIVPPELARPLAGAIAQEVLAVA